MIGAGSANVADDTFEIVFVFDKFPGQCVQQLRIRSGIADPYVIHRVDDPAPQEMRPNDIRQIAREIRVLRRGQPFRQDFAPALVFDFRENGVTGSKIRTRQAAATTTSSGRMTMRSVPYDVMAGRPPFGR